MSDIPARKLTNTAGAARYLGLSISTMAKWRCCGGGPRYLKFGASVKYDYAELDAFRAASTRESTSQQTAA